MPKASPSSPTSLTPTTIPSPSTTTTTLNAKKVDDSFKPFAPGVLAAKAILGQETLNKIRGQTIKAHSQVITEFVKTYVGQSQARTITRSNDEERSDD